MKRILAHLDDVGCSRGSVIAWAALRAAGVVRSASVMVPCPWYPAAVDDWHQAPDQDLGVHLTLTSEWRRYRWRPIKGASGGLVDSDGFFHARADAVQASADPAAVQDELSAQIERARADGIRPTHLDAHMGTAFLPPFLPGLLELSDHYGIPVLACRNVARLLPGLDPGYLAEALTEITRRGGPILDDFLMAFCPDDRNAADHFRALVAAAPAGDHWLALHANAPDDMADFAPHTAPARAKEFHLFSNPDSRSVFADNEATTIVWRDLTGPLPHPGPMR